MADREGTVIPLPPTEAEVAAGLKLAKPENFVPSMTANAESWGGGPSRRLVPVGVVGALGSSYTVFEKNWKCEECHFENVASRPRCVRCRGKKPPMKVAQAAGSAAPEALEENDASAQHGEWREIFDESARHLYYFNAATGETQWERPEIMGPTPHSSGWFGRGAAGGSAAGYESNNVEYLKRPARKQVDYVAAKRTILEGAYEYNIWWSHSIGGDRFEKEAAQREPAETRCVLSTDAGYTKADTVSRSYASANFCLFFARGCCAHGKDCRYFHRIPVKKDLERFAKDETHDIFGRERHRDFRDDMLGVGSLTKPCRTLYAGGLVKSEYESPKLLEEALWRNFGEWGELENVNLISRLSICFLRYRYRSSAEFAKEAMSRNHLDHNENLNIRWAHDDPNPVAENAAARADADALVNMLKAKKVTVDAGNAQVDFETPANYAIRPLDDNDDQRKRTHYPDTNDQFLLNKKPRLHDDHWTPLQDPSDGSTYWWNQITNETSRDAPSAIAHANANRAREVLDNADHVASQLEQHDNHADNHNNTTSALAPSSENNILHPPSSRSPAPKEHGALPPGWQATTDDNYGATYYYNTFTQETTWHRPTTTTSLST